MSKFILIAYKPDSSDTCMGCYMGGYSSDLEVKTNLNETELLDLWSDLKSHYGFRGPNEAGYEFMVIKDGHTVFDEMEGAIDGNFDYDEDDYDEAERLYCEDHNWLDAFQVKLEAATQEKISARKKRRKETEQKRQKEKAQKDKKSRQKRFETLKKEFENG